MSSLPVIYQISFLGILAIIGLIAFKAGILDERAKDVIGTVVFYITLPVMIITKLAKLEFDPGILLSGGLVIIFTYLIIFIQLLIGKLSSKLFKLGKDQANIHTLHTAFGNIVFLGFPLLDAIFPGGEAILYAALYQLVINTVMWTLGISMLDSNKEKTGLANIQKLINPNTVALIIGLIIMFTGLNIPKILMDPLSGLGQTTLYLAMLYIGVLLAQADLKKIYKKIHIIVLSINKLILIPILLIFIIGGIVSVLNLSLNTTAFSVLIIEAAMPCMTILVILAKRYGADDKLAMENFVVSTIFSLFTLPLILFLLEKLQF